MLFNVTNSTYEAKVCTDYDDIPISYCCSICKYSILHQNISICIKLDTKGYVDCIPICKEKSFQLYYDGKSYDTDLNTIYLRNSIFVILLYL